MGWESSASTLIPLVSPITTRQSGSVLGANRATLLLLLKSQLGLHYLQEEAQTFYLTGENFCDVP